MTTVATGVGSEGEQPLQLQVQPALGDRNRLTTAFRLVLAIPHLLLVGGPVAAVVSWAPRDDAARNPSWAANGGVLGAVAIIAAFIAWFAIVFTGRHPEGLWDLAAFYLRWRARAMAYVSLLRDDYPPFGDGAYPAELMLHRPVLPRDRITVAFRLILAIPQLVVLWAVSVAWAITTIIAWFSILFTGRYPASLYDFGVGALRWNIRVEGYLLLLYDQYPPFSLS
jgi:hypothetical protein